MKERRIHVLSWYFFLKVNYFPSRFDPVRHSEKFPIPTSHISGRREKAIIVKENNFQQPGVRFRSFDPARQDRFVGRLSDMLSDPRVTQVLIISSSANNYYDAACHRVSNVTNVPFPVWSYILVSFLSSC